MDPTLGVEVELQVVDLESRKLVPHAPDILAAVNNHPHIKTELLQSTIELNTSDCRDVKEVQKDLMDLKEVVQPICEIWDAAYLFWNTSILNLDGTTDNR